MQFADLRLVEPILKALKQEGYETATPIQAKAIPLVLEGKDVLGSAQTGTGKTAAFAVPILQRLAAGERTRAPRCLVLCPTRELATQIADGFRAYGRNLKLHHTVIFGGVGQNPQVDSLRRGVDVVIATPGRLLDLINQRHVNLQSIQTLVLDEADRMLDMGFINDIRKIVALLPKQRQTLMFSATMPTEIRRLADQLLHNPATVAVAPVSSTVAAIEEKVYFVEKADKGALLAHLYEELAMARAIVFTRTKHGADKVVKQLSRYGIRSEAIHGNKSQNARQRALQNFKAGKTPMLIATDIASRGIDVDMITHVVNFDLTHEPETYVHRIGRTARAGQSGVAVSFCDREERDNLRQIEKLLKRTLRVERELPAFKKLALAHDVGAPRSTHEGHPRATHGERHPHAEARHPAPHRHEHGDRGGRPQHGGHRPHTPTGRPQHPQQESSRPQNGSGRPQHAASRPQAGKPASKPGQGPSRRGKFGRR